MTRTAGRLFSIVVAAALTQACSSAGTDSGVSRRSAGDTTFVSSPAEGTEGPVGLEEVLRIGASAADLGRIDAGAFGPDGTIWLFDGAARNGARIVLLDSLGAQIGQAGRQGAGPGEYRAPLQIFRLANRSMLAKEMRTTRAVRFASSGEVLATLTLPPGSRDGVGRHPRPTWRLVHHGALRTEYADPRGPVRVVSLRFDRRRTRHGTPASPTPDGTDPRRHHPWTHPNRRLR